MNHCSKSSEENPGKWSEVFVNGILVLFTMSIPMMPLFTIYGFYLLGLFTFLLFLLISIRKKIFLTTFDTLYFLFIFFNLLSFIWSVSGHIISTLYEIVYFVLVFSYSHLLYYKYPNMDSVIHFWSKWYLVGTIGVSCACIVFERNTLGFDRLGTYLFAEPFGTYMMYSYSICLGLFICIYKIFQKKRVYLIPLFFLLICCVLNGSRKVLFGLFVFSAITYFIRHRKQPLKLLFFGGSMVVVGIVIYYFSMENEALYNTFGYRIEAYYNYLESGSGDGSAEERSKMVEYGIKYFSDSPIVGWGADSFIYLFTQDYGVKLYSHNNCVELLCNVGLIGFFIYYFIYIRLIFEFNSKYRYKYYDFFYPGIITLLVLDYWTISYFRIQFILFLSLASLYITYCGRSAICGIISKNIRKKV